MTEPVIFNYFFLFFYFTQHKIPKQTQFMKFKNKNEILDTWIRQRKTIKKPAANVITLLTEKKTKIKK